MNHNCAWSSYVVSEYILNRILEKPFNAFKAILKLITTIFSIHITQVKIKPIRVLHKFLETIYTVLRISNFFKNILEHFRLPTRVTALKQKLIIKPFMQDSNPPTQTEFTILSRSFRLVTIYLEFWLRRFAVT